MQERQSPNGIWANKALWIGLFALMYGVSLFLSLHTSKILGEIATFWPASGILLATLFLSRRRMQLLGVALITSLAVYLYSGYSADKTVLYSVLSILEAGVCYLILIALCGPKVDFTRPFEIAMLMAVVLTINGLTAIPRALFSLQTSSMTLMDNWLAWWISNSLSVFILVSCVVTWKTNPEGLSKFSVRRLAEGILITCTLAATAWFIMGPQLVNSNEFILNYVLFPVLVWSAFRFSPRGTSTILFLFTVIAIGLTIQRIDFLNFSPFSRMEEILSVEGILGITSITSLLLATSVADRKRQAQVIASGQAQYRALFEQAHDAVFILDLQGRHVSANQRAADMLGYTVEEVQQMSAFDTSAEIDKSTHVLQRLLAGEHIPLYERLFRKKNGEIFPVEVNVELVRDTAGNPLHIQSVVRDISQRKQAESALLEREKFSQSLLRLSKNLERAQSYADVLQAASDEIGNTIGYRTLWVSLLSEDKETFSLLGAIGRLSKEIIEATGLSTLPINDDPMLKEVAEANHMVIVEDAQTDERTNKDAVVLFGNRTIINLPILLFDRRIGALGMGTFGEEGIRLPTKAEQDYLSTLSSHFAVSLDRIHLMNERAQAEQKLRENESLLTNAHKIAGLGHYVLDIQTGCWESSKILNDIFGIDTTYRTDVNGWLAIIHPEQREEMAAYFFGHVVGEGQPFDKEYRILRIQDHECRWVHGLGELEYDKSGLPLRLFGTIQDITERKQREREIQSFLEISQAIGGTLELPPLLRKILSAAIRAIPNAEKGAVLLLNDEGHLEIKTAVGYSDPRIPLFDFPPTRGYAIRVFRELRPMLIPDVNAAEGLSYRGEVEEMRTIRSAMGAPLMIQDKAIGVITIDNDKRADAFTAENLQVLTTLAASAALAIENARLFDETSHRLAELESLHTLSTSLRLAQTVEEALPIILGEVLKVFETDAGMIMLYDPLNKELKDAVRCGWFTQLPMEALRSDEGIAGLVFQSGEVYVSTEFSSDSLAHPSAQNRSAPGWGGACVPICTAHETIGILFVSVPLPRHISNEQVKLLRSLAEMTAAALQRMKLNEETSRRAAEFAALYQNSTAISGEHDLSSLLQTIVKEATALLHTSGGGMYLYDSVTEELENQFATESSFPIGIKLKLGEGMAGRVAQTRKPMRVDDYSVWESRSEKLDNNSIRAVLEVPMLYAGQLIGVLVAEEVGESTRKFSDDDERLLALFAVQAAGAIHSARLYEEAVQRVRYLQSLRSIDRAITANMDSSVTLKILLNQALIHTSVSAASILLFDSNTLHLNYALGLGFHTTETEGASIRLGELYAGTAAFERRLMSLSDFSGDVPAKFAEFIRKEAFLSCYFVPMIAKGQIQGVIQIFSRRSSQLDHEEMEFIEALATQAAIAVDNARLFQGLQQANFELTMAYNATIEGWSHALDKRFKEVEGHTERVTEWTVQLARAAKLEEKAIGHIRRGAILHDIGNMGIPDSILQKTSELTDEEMQIIRGHPEFGYNMLERVIFLQPALEIVRYHHEKWDGTGYPCSLHGEQIPLAARIFSIVDVWDALTSRRPHRSAWPTKKALAYIRSESGKHFDPELVNIFLRLMDKPEKGDS